MKRLLYTLLAVAAAVGCTKDAEVDALSSTDDVVTFTITDDLTRDSDRKEEWEGGELVAIIASSGDVDAAAVCYKVVKDEDTYDLSLVVNAGSTSIKVSESATTYTVFYPYVEGKTRADYLASNSSDVLTATGDNTVKNAVTFTFSHLNCYVTIICEDAKSDNDAFLTITNGTTTIYSDGINESCSFYAPAIADISNCIIKILVGSSTYIASAATPEITAWKGGDEYKYTVYDACDIYYDTESKVCEIYSAAGLVAFSNLVQYESVVKASSTTIIGETDKNTIIGDVTDKSEICGKLMANIEVTEIVVSLEGWTPIGVSSNTPYSGTFDGDGFEVKLNIDASTSSYQGLFGYISAATIKNVGVTGSVTGGDYSAGVVGYADGDSAIEYCYNKATIDSKSYCGGVVGQMNTTTGRISYCHNTGDVTGTTNDTGGVVGSSYAPISYCYNRGAISTIGYSYYVGGIAGAAYADITCCYNQGDVTTVSYDVGGIAGYFNESTMLNCYNIGDVTGSYYVGGVVGYCKSTPIIYNSYNTGNVKGTDTSSSYIGGITGCNNVEISNCYNAGEVSSAATYEYYTGGISPNKNSTCTNCYYITGSYTVTRPGTTEMGTAEMKSSSFVTTLNDGVTALNETIEDGYNAATWQYNYGTYPTLNFLATE